LTNLDPFWAQFKLDLLERFNSDFKNLVNEFKRIQQTGKVDEYIQNFERIKARVLANQYTTETFYLLGFLSGLKEEIVDAIFLYNLLSLKQAYKLARNVEKSLQSQTKMLRPIIRSSMSFHSSQNRFFRTKDHKSDSSSIDSSKLLESSTSHKTLTLDQKKSLGLCNRCGVNLFFGHKCKNKGLLVLEEEDNNVIDESSEDPIMHSPSYFPLNDTFVEITMCTSDSFTKHRTSKF
jgi:Ty3 transposon capsid-like protein